MSRPKTIVLNLTKKVQVEIMGSYIHDESVEDCEFNLTNVKQSGGSLYELLQYFDEQKDSPLLHLEYLCKEDLHRKETDRIPFLIK